MLRNGIDFRAINESTTFRHSSSVIFDSKNLDKEAILSIQNAISKVDGEATQNEQESFMDKMLLGGGIEDMKVPSKSLVVRTMHAEEYKNNDMFSPNTKGNPKDQKSGTLRKSSNLKLDQIKEKNQEDDAWSVRNIKDVKK